ncbi:hypothetical protein JCM24511_03270 [Saitozyma sp. JCM 24511]|nr:hypothetical protein JCM24511_03270 [Saitozyma sp. JCM 24511]
MGYSGPQNANPPSGEAAIWGYGYVPSLALGIVGVITYIAVMCPHLLLLFRKRGTRSVHGLLFFAGLIEALGFGARLYSHTHEFSGMAFLLGVTLVQISHRLVVVLAAPSSFAHRRSSHPQHHLSLPSGPHPLPILKVTRDLVPRSIPLPPSKDLTLVRDLEPRSHLQGTILITAAMYKSIQRGIKYMPESRRLSPMRPRSLITLFVILDVVWVLLQIGGQYEVAAAQSAKVTGDDPTLALGTSQLVFLAGNVLQAITLIIVSIFIYVILKRSSRVLAGADPSVEFPLLRPLLLQILATFALFFVRLVMRIAEGAQGAYGYSSTHEVFFGVFEYGPLMLILILWAARPLWKFLFPLGHEHATTSARKGDVEGHPRTEVSSGSQDAEVKAAK